VSEVQTQHPPNSEPIIRSVSTKITPQSRRSPIPSPLTQPVQTEQARHIPIIETLKPRREASDLIRDASAPVKTDQTWYPPTNNTTPKPRYSYFLNSDYSDEYYSDDGYSRDPDIDNLYRYFLNSDYRDEYYSDDDYSRDPDVDYTDTICYQPGISTRSSCASGAIHHGISLQPWQRQPTRGAGKSLVKQNPQNRSYPTKPRKERERHKKKRPKPSPPSPPVTGALCAQIKETQQRSDHPPILLPTESAHEHKKRHNQGSPPTSKKAERAQPTDSSAHHPPTLPPHHGDMQNKDVPRPTPTTHGHQL
jgi:hypothetical protein